MPVFGEKNPQQRKTLRVVINELVDRANDNTRRLRILEQRAEILDARDSSTEQTMLQQYKELQARISSLEAMLKERGDLVGLLESRLNETVKQVKRSATTTEVQGLKESVELYNPIKSKFITRAEVEQMLARKR